jgi:hypothetical protein
MKQIYHLNILTPHSLTREAAAQSVLETICRMYPLLTPERYGSYEPLRSMFDPDHIEAAFKDWDYSLHWKRRIPKLEGGIFAAWGAKSEHGWITITVHHPEKVDLFLLANLFQKLCIQLQADFGFIHMLTPKELPQYVNTQVAFCLDPGRQIYSTSVTSYDLMEYIPNLFWATVFGPAYVKHFGFDRLISSEAHVVKALAEDSVYIQLSDSPQDLANDFERVDAVRDRVKKHLNNNSFYVPWNLASHKYKVPEFDLEHKGTLITRNNEEV